MNRLNLSLRHGVFGALFTGALLFGATQAFARPPGYVSIDTTCNSASPGANEYCRAACAAEEEQYVDGRCWSTGYCICQVW